MPSHDWRPPRFKVGQQMQPPRSLSRYVIFWAALPRGRYGESYGLSTLEQAIAYGEEHPEWQPDCIWDAVSRAFAHFFRPVGGPTYRRPAERRIAGSLGDQA